MGHRESAFTPKKKNAKLQAAAAEDEDSSLSSPVFKLRGGVGVMARGLSSRPSPRWLARWCRGVVRRLQGPWRSMGGCAGGMPGSRCRWRAAEKFSAPHRRFCLSSLLALYTAIMSLCAVLGAGCGCGGLGLIGVVVLVPLHPMGSGRYSDEAAFPEMGWALASGPLSLCRVLWCGTGQTRRGC